MYWLSTHLSLSVYAFIQISVYVNHPFINHPTIHLYIHPTVYPLIQPRAHSKEKVKLKMCLHWAWKGQVSKQTHTHKTHTRCPKLYTLKP